METIGNVIVGKPDVKPDAPAHLRGVRGGNKRRTIVREPGIKHTGRFTAWATARRSTGINARGRQPIDPRMPLLTPA